MNKETNELEYVLTDFGSRNGTLVNGQKVSREILQNGDKITIDLLYGHRSGIPHRVMPPEQETVPYTSAEMVEKIKVAKLAFEPGSERLYSSAGYTVLARLCRCEIPAPGVGMALG